MARPDSLLVLIYFIYYHVFVISDSICNQHKTCTQCITYASASCVWCNGDPISTESEKLLRCQNKETFHDDNWCNGAVENPQNEVIDNQSRPMNDTIKYHFRPQKLKLKARPGVPYKFNLEYQLGNDYELDLYLIIDNSYSLRHQRKKISESMDRLFDKLSGVSKRIRVGFGSYVEKRALPYGNKKNSYSFKNHVSLSKTAENVTRALRENKLGSNYDDLEDPLTALLQAMVCTEEIGWSDIAFRIIIIFNDDKAHSAGDGKMAGAYHVNDMKCHLDDYDAELKYDYPSISQINKVAMENNIRIIFTSTKSEDYYKELSRHVRGSNYASLGNHLDIAQAITDEYLTLLHKPQLVVKSPPHIQVILDPSCEKENVPSCTAFDFEAKQIEVTIIVNECTSENREETIEISLLGLDEKFLINVEPICQCECSRLEKRIYNSTLCNSLGSYQCGICDCNEGRSGEFCSCNVNQINDFNSCKHDTTSLVCSGMGECRCGECICNDSTGKYCEYPDSLCPSPKGIRCGGHGSCNYGQCVCNHGWTGDDCMCPTRNDACVGPYSNKECSGNGKCLCGKCTCETDKGNSTSQYYGPYCDSIEQRCKELEELSKCTFMGQIKSDSCLNVSRDTGIYVKLVNKTQFVSEEYSLAWTCSSVLDETESSNIVYKFRYDNGRQLEMLVQNEPDIPGKINLVVAVCSFMGAVLFIGILTLLIWKVLIDIHDAREYKRFVELTEEALANDAFIGENPSYRQPKSSFVNPIFKRLSFRQ